MTTPAGGSVDPLDQRIGDAERTTALNALGEHLAAGRLDLTEYESRSSQVTTARTQRDLAGLFVDLPGPTPAAQAQVAARPAYAAAATPPPIVPAPTGERRKQLASAVGGITALACVIVYFLVRGSWDQAWLVFLAVPLAGLIAQLMVREQNS